MSTYSKTDCFPHYHEACTRISEPDVRLHNNIQSASLDFHEKAAPETLPQPKIIYQNSQIIS